MSVALDAAGVCLHLCPAYDQHCRICGGGYISPNSKNNVVRCVHVNLSLRPSLFFPHPRQSFWCLPPTTMHSIQDPTFGRKLSFGSLIDLSEKQALGRNAIRPRVAIIGAGITGISTACHILDAGYECHIFEAGDESSIGGIWTRVNETSQLQIHSNFYKFHDAVCWQSEYPNRKEILGQIRRLWDFYGLSERSTFGCKVESTYQEEDGKWVINSPSNGYFDGLVAAVGTCGDVYAPTIAGQDSFKGKVLHSSELERNALKGKDVLIIGGGASAVEALEFACDNGAKTVKVLARVCGASSAL